jgi:hypothetical protein
VCQYERWYNAGILCGIKSAVFVGKGLEKRMMTVVCVEERKVEFL